MTTSDFDWVPTVSVGRIKFGEPVTEHVESGYLRYREGPLHKPGEGGYVHGDDEDPSAYLDDEKRVVDSVNCFTALIYRGQNLIGIPIKEALDILGQLPDISGDKILEDDDEYTVEFDRLGLILWVREEDDTVVSASVGTAAEDD